MTSFTSEAHSSFVFSSSALRTLPKGSAPDIGWADQYRGLAPWTSSGGREVELVQAPVDGARRLEDIMESARQASVLILTY